MRISTHPILPLILNRHSPRAFSDETLADEELLPLFEAARWAPSSYNNQPWRFLYAHRNTQNWELFFQALVPFNQAWCKNASVLVAVLAKKTFDFNNEPSSTYAFDTGAAWENLALEASSRGLIAHGMEGFDHEILQKNVHTPENFSLLAMIAIGKLGNKAELPVELQEKEIVSNRRPLSEIVAEGIFSW